jgi:hypothetical protein
MKGMNTTLILNETEQPVETLESTIGGCCDKHGIHDAQKEYLINKGLSLFKLDSANDFVFPLGEYQTITEYVLAHRNDHDAVMVEEGKLTKEHLYNRLVKAATAGSMDEYRRLRKLYLTT